MLHLLLESKMNNIILFATYWNEIEWIRPSLEQILKINPIEIIICDGNFDPKIENKSTDGTREIIEQFVKENGDRARIISAIRTKPTLRGYGFFKNAGRKDETIKLSRLNFALRSQFIINEYRVNQALTFSKMMNLSKYWQPGNWVMSYDADQFYSDELIDYFKITNTSSEYDLITADEWTFPYDYNHYTDKYEIRKNNNLPHKISKNIAVYPTRHFMKESMFGYQSFNEKNSFHGGNYFHYKFRQNQKRLEDGYKLGDRRPPKKSRYNNLMPFKGEHPEVISKLNE
jgi:hypothetical protein